MSVALSSPYSGAEAPALTRGEEAPLLSVSVAFPSQTT